MATFTALCKLHQTMVRQGRVLGSWSPSLLPYWGRGKWHWDVMVVLGMSGSLSSGQGQAISNLKP